MHTIRLWIEEQISVCGLHPWENMSDILCQTVYSAIDFIGVIYWNKWLKPDETTHIGIISSFSHVEEPYTAS